MANETPKKKYMPSKMKYNCALSGEKRAEPCAACPDSSKCMTDSLQVKEPSMNTQEKRPVAKIGADGNIAACAKGLEAGECGYKAGAKVCGKCGALAVQMKMGAEMAEDEIEDELEDIAEDAAEVAAKKRMMKKRRQMGAMMSDEEDDEEAMGGKGAYNQGMSYVDDPMDADFKKRRRARHKKRMQSMGMKSDLMEDDVFLCAQTREIKSATSLPCEGCRGGCKSDNASPDILEIEALAEDVLGLKVHFSGYGDEFGMFVVQGHRKSDDQAIETYWTDDGDLDGWFRIPEEELMGKSAVIALDEAVGKAIATIADHTKSDAQATGYGIGQFDGKETIVIEVKSGDTTFDVHVTPEGDVPGFEQIEVKSEQDEDLEVKRMFTDEQRMQMAEGGEALPDGSYPIANEEDLKNAIQAYGRAKDKEAAKAHIMKRARAMGKMDLIPQEWMGGKKDAGDDVESLLEELSFLEAQASLQDLLGED